MRASRCFLPLLALACTPAAVPTSPTTAPSAVVAANVDTLIARLSVKQKVAQLVMPFLPGSYASADDSAFLVASRWVDNLEVGGVIVSVGSPYDIALKLNNLQRRSKLPLLVSADLEWGAGMRLNGGTTFTPIMSVGATGDPLDAYTMGRAAALEGRAVGIHVNFAPGADVNNNPLNPIINTRSFGEDPLQVGKLVAAFVRGVREHGMLSTLKHFPGHGDTETDSHIGLPTIRAGYARLDSIELVPFRAGIAAGADVVMSAHIAFPALTGNEPGTMSAAVLSGMLRDSLGFRGLVVTDALTMGAIVAKYGAGEATVRAFLAGSDLLLMPSDPDSAIDAMIGAVQAGRITPARLDASVRRLLEIKQRLGLFVQRTVVVDSIPNAVGRRALLEAAEDIASRAVTLVRDTIGTLQNLRKGNQRVALISYADELNSFAGNRMAEVMRAGGLAVTTFRLWPSSGPASYDSARATIGRAANVVFAANVRPLTSRGHVALPDSLARLIMATDSVKPTVLVSLGSPYLLSQTPTVKSYLLAWSGARVAERAAGRAIAGQSPIRGHLPIRIPPAYPVGFGIVINDSIPTPQPAARP